MGHDFNNLTAIVLGYGEMLHAELHADDHARKWAQAIGEAVASTGGDAQPRG